MHASSNSIDGLQSQKMYVSVADTKSGLVDFRHFIPEFSLNIDIDNGQIDDYSVGK